jgi:hypothetical protein
LPCLGNRCSGYREGVYFVTTPAAERLYLSQHLLEMDGRKLAFFNPKDRPIDELPVIYGFNNGGSPGWYSAVLLAEDGTGLGGHICSAEGYMPHDLGILEGTRPDRHEEFRMHYPDGYRMEFIGEDRVRTHEGLLAAYKRNQEQPTPGAPRDE